MGCNNDGQLSGNIPNNYDFSILFTGCATECNGVTITPGQTTIRTVLDALLQNCGISTGNTNVFLGVNPPTLAIDAKDKDYYIQGNNGHIWQYSIATSTEPAKWTETTMVLGGGGITEVNWGDIMGDINSQQDLIDLINSTEVDLSTKAGIAMSYNSTTQKLDVGSTIAPGFRGLLFGNTEQAVFMGFNDSTNSGAPDASKANIVLQPFGVTYKYVSQSGDNVIELGEGGFNFTGNSATVTNTLVNFGNDVSITANEDVFITASSGSMYFSSFQPINFEAQIINLGASSTSPQIRLSAGGVTEIGGVTSSNPAFKTVDSQAEFPNPIGFIMKSADNKRWRVTVSNAGALVVTQVV